MDHNFEGILVSLDGSLSAEKALITAKALAVRLGSRLVLYRVPIPLRASVFLSAVDEVGGEGEEGPMGTLVARGYLEQLVEDLSKESIDARYELGEEEKLDAMIGEFEADLAFLVARLITTRLEENDVDLLVMASHGVTSRLSNPMGNVASQVLRLAAKPILLVPVS